MNSWSLREQLCLASSVLKSGDQNWMNVSRSVKTIASQNSVERFDWFSQRACAQQYTYLIKNMDITKRKKRESGEAAGECIVRRLTHDRISELSRILKTHRDQYLHLKNEWSLLKNGTISDEKLRKMWCAIEQEESPHKQDVEQELSEDTSCIINSPSREPEHENDRQTTARTHDRNNFESCFDRARALSPSSSESPSPTKDCHISVAESNLFLIPSLPITKMEQGVEQLEMQSSIFVESGPDKHCQSIQTYHRKNVPTLAKLLETSSPEIQKMIYDNSHNSTNQMDGSIVGCTKESKCTELTGTQTCGESSTSFQTTRKHERKTLGSDLNSDSIRGVEAEASTTDKNEINKIVGDIEGSIKKEITDGFSTLATGTASSDASLNSKFHDQITTYSGSLESKNSDDSNLSSDSPSNGMCMGEIDSSTSNIAEIIGTPIDTMKASILVVGQSQEYKMDEQPRIIDEGVFKSSTEVMKDDELQQKPSLVGSFHVFGSTASLDERRSSMIASDRYCDGQIDDCQEIQKVEDLEDSSEEKSAREASERVSTQSRGALNESTTQLSDNQSTYEYDDPSCRSENIECHEKQNEDNAGESRSIMSLSEKDEDCDDVEQNLRRTGGCEFAQPTQMAKSYDAGNSDSSENVVGLVGAEWRGELDCRARIGGKLVQIQRLVELSPIQPSGDTKQGSMKVEVDEFHKIIDSNEVKIGNEVFNHSPIVDPSHLDTGDSRSAEEGEELNKGAPTSEVEYKDSFQHVKIEHSGDSLVDNDCNLQVDVLNICVGATPLKLESKTLLHNFPDEDESSLTKLNVNRMMKTYSKKHNTVLDCETESDTVGENADYRAWKKSILLVYNRLITHKYASIFLKPITEDQAPGYHSIIFRPMDLWTIKKNIDNGTIRSTLRFQRDVMLMFQNAIIYNKHNTIVHKMTLEMQEECLQHMQILVRAVDEASFKRETRTATNTMNDLVDGVSRRKWTQVSSMSEIDGFRVKKRRKSEND